MRVVAAWVSTAESSSCPLLCVPLSHRVRTDPPQPARPCHCWRAQSLREFGMCAGACGRGLWAWSCRRSCCIQRGSTVTNRHWSAMTEYHHRMIPPCCMIGAADAMLYGCMHTLKACKIWLVGVRGAKPLNRGVRTTGFSSWDVLLLPCLCSDAAACQPTHIILHLDCCGCN